MILLENRRYENLHAIVLQHFLYNHLTTITTPSTIFSFSSASCKCPPGYDGPRCQKSTISFPGNGYAWFPSLQTCFLSRLSFEFMTRMPTALLLYNGPMRKLKSRSEVNYERARETLRSRERERESDHTLLLGT